MVTVTREKQEALRGCTEEGSDLFWGAEKASSRHIEQSRDVKGES